MTPSKLLIGQILIVFAIVIGAVWGATQWAAGELQFQPRLGPAWFEFFGYPVYLPWRLFEWWYAYEAYAPAVFNHAGIIAASGGVVGVAVAIAGSLWRARQNQLVTTYGSSRWATKSEIARSGLYDDRGVFLGRLRDRYLRHDGPEHVMCFAPTRSGKGVGLVIPTLLSWPHSAAIHDIKGENWQLTAGWRSRFSHCLLFNPTDPASAKYNPLLEVRKGPFEVRDVQNIADILVDPEGALERRNHWEKTSHSLLVGVILHVLYAEEDKTLARVAGFLSDPSRSFERTLRVMLGTNHLGTDEAPQVHPVVAQVARELLNKAENERSGVLSTAMSFLSLYRDPTVAVTTSACEWRIADLVEAEHPVSLYLVIPPSDISRTKPLVRLILNQIGRRLTERLEGEVGKRRRHQLLMMLDEFPALGRLDFFESALAFMAGYGVRSFLIAQSLNQISKAYGEHNAILDNCHVRVAFATNDERTAKRISDSLGTATELRAQRNYAGHRLAPWLAHVMVSRQETARPLLTPGEVMQLPADEEIVMISGQPPIRAKKLRYFEDGNFSGRVCPPPGLKAGGPYADRPPHRPDDWLGQVRGTHAGLAKPWSELVTGDDEDDGGLKRHPGLPDEAPTIPEPDQAPDAGLLDDEFDPNDARRMEQLDRNSAAVRRAHAMDQSDDDLLPNF
ncbi:conjugal transfer protein TraG [Chelativorans sp. M5D2P16]|uniref:conjugal transfer protein TraG n=1 Tax=Chelativorans sp. M5D2P16 TaxID=3095678 RepID=UPI002ACA4C46|nr:conjugal transfer protein TraG [Chelativorans sp. M5D2P16]MDZ5696727.1 conjugal transfer protein TraG [Chelativorans sp. M5D2P16]